MSRLSFNNDICSMTSNMLQSKVAIIGEVFALNSLYIRFCNLSSLDVGRISFTDNKLFGTQMHFWPLLRNSVWIKSFNKLIITLEESGIFSHWVAEEMGSISQRLTRKCKNPTLEIMQMEEIYFPLTLLLGGYLISIVVFVQEIIPITILRNKIFGPKPGIFQK
ncbi:uncharacterized protein LOC130899987 [Diorhabda carinulata]|uniref:uncharacterized protein LOC130899987 n=1 Tax=Diorhabda carinulata TaxID=1163345 RepID=UPI0025A24F6A|nr:uncharacterized protein LOC130899987 [Diorhabda carinulata]